MRVLIASPRKSGGPHLRCLFASAYGLGSMGSRDAPDASDGQAIASWLAGLPDGVVTGADYAYSPALAAAAETLDVTLVAILRHPFDLFLTIYDVAQQRAARKKDTAEDIAFWNTLAGLRLDGPEMLAYAGNGFGREIEWLISWKQSGAATVRFEDLSTDPLQVLTRFSNVYGTIPPERVVRSVEICPPESLVVSRPFRGRRMGDLPAGTWRERLPSTVLNVLRADYSEAAEILGYGVR